MGFRLTNEGKIIPNKFILSERLILTEAVDWTNVKNACEALNTFASNLTKTLNQTTLSSDSNETTYQAIEKGKRVFTAIQNTIKNVKDPAMVKGELDKFLDELKEIFTAIDHEFKKQNHQFEKTFSDLITLVGSSDYSGKVISDIRGKIDTILKAFENFLKDKTTFKFDKEDQKAAKKAAEKSSEKTWTTATREGANTNLKRMLAVAKKLLDSGDIAKASKAIGDALGQNLIDLSTKAAAVTFPVTDITKVDPVLEFSEKLYNSAEGKNLIAHAEEMGINVEKDAQADAGEGINWNKLYRELKDTPDIFWKKYYDEEWKEYARTVESFGAAFKQECEVLGFSSKSNPFLRFLDMFLRGAHKYKITADHYVALHDSVANSDAITKADLAGVKESGNAPGMIVCFKDFYAKPGIEAQEYFDQLDKFRYSINPSALAASEDENIKTFFDSFEAGLVSNKTEIQKAIFFETCSFDSLINGTAGISGTTEIAEETTKVRPIEDIQTIVDMLLAGKATSGTWSDDDTVELLGRIHNLDDAKLFIYVITTAFGTTGTIKKLKDKVAWFKSYSASLDKIVAVREDIERTSRGEISDPEAKSIAKAIASMDAIKDKPEMKAVIEHGL